MDIYKQPYELSLWHDVYTVDDNNDTVVNIFESNKSRFQYGSQFDFQKLKTFSVDVNESGGNLKKFRRWLSYGIINLNTLVSSQGTIILVVPEINNELFQDIQNQDLENSQLYAKISNSYFYSAGTSESRLQYHIKTLDSWNDWKPQFTLGSETTPESVKSGVTFRFCKLNITDYTIKNCGLILEITWIKGRNAGDFNLVSIPYIDANDLNEQGYNDFYSLYTYHYNNNTLGAGEKYFQGQHFPNLPIPENLDSLITLWVWNKNYHKNLIENEYYYGYYRPSDELIDDEGNPINLDREEILNWYTNQYYTQNNIQISNYYNEIKDIIIGSNISTSPYRACNVNLITNINNSNTLTFTLYGQFYDQNNNLCENPLINMIINESKLKLRINNGDNIEWYEFIVKNITRNRDKNSLTYTCTDRFVDELSKQGYNVEFDTELMNNIGTAQDLAKLTLQDTDWEVDYENSDILIETNLSPLYYVIGHDYIEKNNIKYIINFDKDNQLQHNNLLTDYSKMSIDDENYFSVEDIQGYFLPYNYSKCHNQLFLLINKSFPTAINIDDFLVFVEENYMTDDYELIANNIQFLFNGNNYKLVAVKVDLDLDLSNIEKILTIFYGKILTQNYIYEFDPITQKIIQIYKNEDETSDRYDSEFGVFTENEFISPVLVSNYVSNSSNFTSTTGYNMDDGTCQLSTVGPTWLVTSKISSANQKFPVLKCIFLPNRYLKVSSIETNISQIKNIHKGEKYVLRIRASRVSGDYSPRPRNSQGNEYAPAAGAHVYQYALPARPLGFNNNNQIPYEDYRFSVKTGNNWDREMTYIGFWAQGDYTGDMCSAYPITAGKGVCGKIAEYQINSNGHYELTKTYMHFSWGHTPEYECLEDFPVYNKDNIYNFPKSWKQQYFSKENDDTQNYIRLGFFTDLKNPSDLRNLANPDDAKACGYNNPLWTEPINYGKYNESSHTDGRGLCNAQQHLLENEKDTFYIPETNSIGAYNVFNYQFKYMIGVSDESLTEKDLKTKKIGLFLYSWGPLRKSSVKNEINLEDIQLFPFKTVPANFTAKVRETQLIKYNQSSQWWDIDEILNDENIDINLTGLVIPLSVGSIIQESNSLYYETQGVMNFSKGDTIYYENSTKTGYYIIIDSGEEISNNQIRYPILKITTPIKGKTFIGQELILPDYVPTSNSVNRNIWKGYYRDNLNSTYNNEQFSTYLSDDQIQNLLAEDKVFNISEFGVKCFEAQNNLLIDNNILKDLAEQLLELLNLLINADNEASLDIYVAGKDSNNTLKEGCYIFTNNDLYNIRFNEIINKQQFLLLKKLDQILGTNYSPQYKEVNNLRDTPEGGEDINNLNFSYYYESEGHIRYTLTFNNYQEQIKFVLALIDFNSRRFSFQNDTYSPDQIDYFYKQTIPPEDFNKKWVPLLNDTYEKRRTISIKESNYFNILQTICETFECWMKLENSHEDSGKIELVEIKDNNGFIIDKTPNKKIIIKNNIGQNNYAGFKSKINLKNITRSLASDALASHLIVRNNNNNFAKNGFCSIVRAEDNKLHENELFNFDYYTKINLINRNQLINDLYGENGFLTEISKENQNKNKLIDLLISINSDLPQLEANCDFYKQAYDSVNEQLQADLAELNLYTENHYSTIDDALKGTAGATDKFILKYRTKLEINKYNSLDFFEKYSYWSNELQDMTEKYVITNDTLNSIKRRVNNKKQQFYIRYSPYIKDGVWSSEDYVDDNLYYLDAIHKLAQVSKPRVSYLFDVISVEVLPEYSLYRYTVGDRTYIEDGEFFGYKSDGVTPVKEEVIVTEINRNLDEPDKTIYKVQNFQDNFKSLFQRITASVNQLK